MLQDLLCITGSIDTNRGDVEGYNGFKNALLSATQHNLEHEVLTGDEVNARFPGYNLPSNFMVQFCYACLLHRFAFVCLHVCLPCSYIPLTVCSAVLNEVLCVAVPKLHYTRTPAFPPDSNAATITVIAVEQKQTRGLQHPPTCRTNAVQHATYTCNQPRRPSMLGW